jgi:AraC-like DNA-binding protein
MKPNFAYPLLKPEDSFRTFLKKQDVQQTPLHYHPNYEMNFVINGLGTRYVGDNIEQFEEGDLILLAPNIPHCWKNTDKGQQPYSSLVIQWKDDFLGSGWDNISEFGNIRRLLKLSSKGIKFDKYIANEIKKHQSELLMLPPFEKLLLLLQLLNDLGKTNEFKILSNAELPLESTIYNARIEIVSQYIKEKYGEKITLGKVAELVNMSQGAFSRFFSKTTQKPFCTFLNEYRIKMACKALLETDGNADEIGYACGYECLQFFYRQFSKYAKCSPQVFRKKAKSIN